MRVIRSPAFETSAYFTANCNFRSKVSFIFDLEEKHGHTFLLRYDDVFFFLKKKHCLWSKSLYLINTCDSKVIFYQQNMYLLYHHNVLTLKKLLM